MNIDLNNEVRSSFVFRTYNRFSKLNSVINYFKWTALILMIVGFIDTFLFNGPHKLVLWSNVGIWIPGSIFAIIFLTFHALTGLKLKSLSKKYNIHPFQLKIIVDRILNQ